MFDFDGNSDDEGCVPNVLEVARENPDLTTIVTLIEAAELEAVFQCSGPFTLLLPSNAAFDDIGGDELVEILLDPINRDILQDILLYHVLPGAFPSSTLQAGMIETLLAGFFVTVSLNPIMFNDAGVDMADVPACNGLYYVLDTVLIPDAPGKLTEERSGFSVLTFSHNF